VKNENPMQRDVMSESGGCGSKAPEATTAGRSAEKPYWRSVEDLESSPEFAQWMHREFQDEASEASDDDRRDFLKLMGASVALAAGVAGCRRRPELHILPYAQRPANRMDGVPVHYATAWELDGVAHGVLAKSFDGRPIKVDGNPSHPINRGRSDSMLQATVLELYDPARGRDLLRKGQPSTLTAFREWCSSLAATGGKGLAVLAEPSSGPTMADLKARLAKRFPQMAWYTWFPANDDYERIGTESAFGAPMRPLYELDRAKVILSLDSDFLQVHPAAVKHARDFAAARRITGDPAAQAMSRLYVAESALSLTGANADERLPMRSADVGGFGAKVAALLAEKGLVDPGACAAPLATLAASEGTKAALTEHDLEIVAALVEDLAEHRGASLVVAGPGQPPAVHALAAMLNVALGNVGKTVTYLPNGEKGRTATGDLTTLTGRLNAGEISTLVVVGGNPVYDAPVDLDFAKAMAKAAEVVHLSFYRNETGVNPAVTWNLPRAHYLEGWGDGRAFDGTICVTQPLIEPMVGLDQGGLTPIELAAELLGEDPKDGYGLVRRTWMATLGTQGAEFEAAWRGALQSGILETRGAKSAVPLLDVAGVAKSLGELASCLDGMKADAVEVTFAADPKIHDGRFGNVGWLQELPAPMSKLTWDNAAYVSIGTAAKLGVRQGDLLSIDAGGRTLTAAAWVMPGMANGSVALQLGYGRTGPGVGPIATDAGFNAYAIRASDAMGFTLPATVAKADGKYPFAHTQDHGAVDALKPEVPMEGIQERLPALVRETSLDHYRDHPDFAKHATHVAHRLSLWEETNLDGARFRWAMSIDLSSCTGCGACITACQAENNIGVVGKAQVMRGREMHWIRVDRYFKGSDQARPAAVAVQPVACMHCENAPCEQVCPVAATVHDEDGLNSMVYNRCIGTRYCSNNCPYKVRRFNFFDWNRKEPSREETLLMVQPSYYEGIVDRAKDGPNDWLRMQFNPEVTVRARGVMEKCTFCTQRIQEAKIQRKNAWAKAGGTASGQSDWSIPDGTVVTACQQACPSEAIVFGDLNDSESRVAKLHRSARSYQLLEELNVKARLQYLAKVRNPALDHSACDHDHGHGHGHDHDHAAATAGLNGTRA
jgi:molybdopterin-containing oxidoreductase family iron-sulfur binding subunit